MALHGLDNVKKMIAKNKRDTNDKLRKIYFKGLGVMIKETPVDDGRARNNWFLTAGLPSGLVGRSESKNGNGSQQSLNTMPKYVLNKKIYFTNNLPYIGMLEYGGYGSANTKKTNSRGFSKLAPRGWVRIELQQMQNKIIMSYLKTKQALLTKLLAASVTGVSSSDIAFENKKFNPTGKAAWLACYFIPASTESMGKTLDSGDEQRGIFQVSVFVALNSDEYDNKQLTIADEILSEFQYSTSTVYNGQQVDILESTVNNGTENEAYFKRDISINYLTFSIR